MKITKNQLKKIIKEEIMSEVELDPRLSDVALGPFGIIKALLRGDRKKALSQNRALDLEVNTGVDDDFVNIDYRIKVPHHGNKQLATKLMKMISRTGKLGDQGSLLKQLLRLVGK